MNSHFMPCVDYLIDTRGSLPEATLGTQYLWMVVLAICRLRMHVTSTCCSSARDTIAELKRRTIGGTPLLNTPTPTQSNARPLGLENTDLSNVPIWKLPDETVDYSANLGNPIPLPRGDVDIPQDLLQNDPLIDDPPIEPATDNRSRPLTIPCSINLRRLDAKDVSMWSPKPILNKILPDATPGTSNIDPESKLKHYNLRDHERKVQRNPVRNRPQRTVSKPMTYAESIDDSSQDSQIIGTVYTLDSRPPQTPRQKKLSA